MNNIVKKFLIFLGILIVGYLTYILLTHIKNNFSIVVFYTYLTIGLLINGGGIIALIIGLATERTILNENVENNQKLLLKKSLIYYVRQYLSSFLALLYSTVHWFAIIVKSFKDSIQNRNTPNIKSTKNDLHAISLMVFDVWFSIYALLSIFIVLILNNEYTNISIQIIFIAIILRHFNYIIEIDALPTRLRRALINPYVSYIIILIFDLLSLLVASTYFLNNTILVNYNMYYHSLVKLFGYKDLLGYMNGVKFIFNDYLIFTAGFMLYMSLLKMLFSFKKFEKVDEDYTWVAQRQVQIGKYTKALDTINRVKGFTEVDYLIKIATLLGTNNLNGAIDLSKDYNKIFHHIKRNTINDIFRTLMDVSISFDMGDRVHLSIITYGLNDNVNDCLLFDLSSVVILSSETLRNGIMPIIANQKNKYKITYSYLTLQIENNQKISEILNSRLRAKLETIKFTSSSKVLTLRDFEYHRIEFYKNSSQKAIILVFIKEYKNIENILEYIMLSNLELSIMSEDKYYTATIFNKLKEEFFNNLKKIKIHKYSILKLTILSLNISQLFSITHIDNIYKEQLLLFLKKVYAHVDKSEIKNNIYSKKIAQIIHLIDPE